MATISSGHVERLRGDVARELAWREQRLVFSEDRLDYVAEQFNRYNRTQLRVEGAAAKAVSVTGAYDIHSFERILSIARGHSGLTVTQQGNDWIIKSKT